MGLIRSSPALRNLKGSRAVKTARRRRPHLGMSEATRQASRANATIDMLVSQAHSPPPSPWRACSLYFTHPSFSLSSSLSPPSPPPSSFHYPLHRFSRSPCPPTPLSSLPRPPLPHLAPPHRSSIGQAHIIDGSCAPWARGAATAASRRRFRPL